jgi:hypothetical protein
MFAIEIWRIDVEALTLKLEPPSPQWQSFR